MYAAIKQRPRELAWKRISGSGKLVFYHVRAQKDFYRHCRMSKILARQVSGTSDASKTQLTLLGT